MRIRGLVAALLCLTALTIAATAAAAQEPSPSATEQPCAQGQLCGNGGSGFNFTTVPAGKVNDPPGAVERSLITAGLIALVLLAYLYIAL